MRGTARAGAEKIEGAGPFDSSTYMDEMENSKS